MTTFFVDFENGNDNYAGTSFNAVSGIDGRITGAGTTGTFTTYNANQIDNLFQLLGPDSPSDQYISIFNGSSYVTYLIGGNVIGYTDGSRTFDVYQISGGPAVSAQSVDRQYFIGGRWRTLNTGATAARIMPGDFIRVMASPEPTSLGVNGTWTSSSLANILIISSSSNTSPISITSTNHGYTTGDTVVISNHTTNTNANGTWEITVTGANTFTLNGSTGNGVGGTSGFLRNRNNSRVMLSSALTQNIASFGNRGQGRTAWTTADATNVTVSLTTADYKEGDCSDSISVGANFTTGRAAYKATGTLNLSNYQQVSFWIKQTAGTVVISGDLSLRLCSDTVGSTVVHTINVPPLGALNVWQPVTVDLGTNLNSNIQSVALYIDTDRSGQTFLLSNIIACKASSSNDSLNLASLIGKNKLVSNPSVSSFTNASEPWLCIQSINGTRVMLDGPPNNTPASATTRGYFGTSETIETFKRETVKIPLSNSLNGLVLNEAGTADNFMNIWGGWNRVDMSTWSGKTYLDGRISSGTAVTNRAFQLVDNFAFVRFNVCIDIGSGANCILNIDEVNSCATVVTASTLSTINIGNVCCNTNVCASIGAASTVNISGLTASNTNIMPRIYNRSKYRFGYSANNSTTINMGNSPLGGNTIYNTFSTDGLAFYNGFGIDNVASNCTFHSVESTAGNLYLYNTTLTAATEAPMSSAFSDAKIFSHNHDNIPNNHVIFTDGGRISTNTSVRYTDSGFSWAMAPTSTNRSVKYPLYLKLATVAVTAGSVVTIKAWMRRTNTLLDIGLRIPEYNSISEMYDLPDYNYDFSSFMSAPANTWQEVTLLYTPIDDRVIKIYADAFGGTTHTGYIDNLTIIQ